MNVVGELTFVHTGVFVLWSLSSGRDFDLI